MEAWCYLITIIIPWQGRLYCIYYLVQRDINKQEDLLSREEHESENILK
jgi:hypothetical protein